MSNRTEYSPHKIVHHPEIIQKLRNKEHFYPIQAHLVPTNRCNQNCNFCAYRLHGYSSSQNFGTLDQMSTEKLLEIITDLGTHGTKAIQFTGGGEPTVHPDICKAFDCTYKHNMDLGLVSNGVAWTDEIIGYLSKASWVRVSVDCYDPKTYARTRNVKESHFHKMVENITKLVKVKSGDTILGVGYVITEDNWCEVYQSAKFFKEIGVDNFRISAAFTNKGFSYFDGWFEQAKSETIKTFNDFNDDGFTVFNLFNDRVSDLFDGTQNYDFCPMKSLVPYIGADCIVYTCCTLAYNDLGVVGDVKNQTFNDLWMSQKTIDFMYSHNPKKYCRLPCMFEKKNEFINYCISNEAKHTSFI